jgi:phage-related protein
MPVVALGDLAVIIIAGLALLLLIAWQKFADAIAALMPSFHIPGLGSIRHWVQSRFNDAFDLIKDAFGSLIVSFEQIFIYPILAVERLFSYILNSIASTFSELYHIVKLVVPNVIRYIGSSVTNAVHYAEAMVNSLRAYAIAYATNILHYLTASLHAVEVFLLQHIAAVIAATRAWAQAAIALALQYTTNVLNYLTSSLHAVEVFLLQHIASQIAAVYAWSTAAIGNLARYVDQRFTQAVHYAEAIARVAARDAIAVLTGECITDLIGLWPKAIAAVDGAVTAAEGGFADALDEWRTIER